jgi:hypothetical protein
VLAALVACLTSHGDSTISERLTTRLIGLDMAVQCLLRVYDVGHTSCRRPYQRQKRGLPEGTRYCSLCSLVYLYADRVLAALAACTTSHGDSTITERLTTRLIGLNMAVQCLLRVYDVGHTFYRSPLVNRPEASLENYYTRRFSNTFQAKNCIEIFTPFKFSVRNSFTPTFLA